MAAPASSVATAAANGDTVAVKELLACGADVNQPSSDGMAPLAIAAFWGYADIVKLLLENGADCNQCNRGTLWTPLHCAAFQGHGKAVMHLLDYPVDLLAKDSQGRTPVDFASAIDAIWPFFADAGCRQTPKADLIRMDIIKKVLPRDAAHHRTELLGPTRPGSAYIFNTDCLHRRNTDKMDMAASTGDVLASTDDSDNGYIHTTMAIWNT